MCFVVIRKSFLLLPPRRSFSSQGIYLSRDYVAFNLSGRDARGPSKSCPCSDASPLPRPLTSSPPLYRFPAFVQQSQAARALLAITPLRVLSSTLVSDTNTAMAR